MRFILAFLVYPPTPFEVEVGYWKVFRLVFSNSGCCAEKEEYQFPKTMMRHIRNTHRGIYRSRMAFHSKASIHRNPVVPNVRIDRRTYRIRQSTNRSVRNNHLRIPSDGQRRASRPSTDRKKHNRHSRP